MKPSFHSQSLFKYKFSYKVERLCMAAKRIRCVVVEGDHNSLSWCYNIWLYRLFYVSLSVVHGTSSVSGGIFTVLGSKSALLHPSLMLGRQIHLYVQLLPNRYELKQVQEQECCSSRSSPGYDENNSISGYPRVWGLSHRRLFSFFLHPLFTFVSCISLSSKKII